MPRAPRKVTTTSGCRRVLLRWHDSTRAVTARWKSVNSWSNRFASLAVLALAAGCHSTPRHAQPGTPDARVNAGPSAGVPAPGGTMPGVGQAAPGPTGAGPTGAGPTAPGPTSAAPGGAVKSGAP